MRSHPTLNVAKDLDDLRDRTGRLRALMDASDAAAARAIDVVMPLASSRLSKLLDMDTIRTALADLRRTRPDDAHTTESRSAAIWEQATQTGAHLLHSYSMAGLMWVLTPSRMCAAIARIVASVYLCIELRAAVRFAFAVGAVSEARSLTIAERRSGRRSHPAAVLPSLRTRSGAPRDGEISSPLAVGERIVRDREASMSALLTLVTEWMLGPGLQALADRSRAAVRDSLADDAAWGDVYTPAALRKAVTHTDLHSLIARCRCRMEGLTGRNPAAPSSMGQSLGPVPALVAMVPPVPPRPARDVSPLHMAEAAALMTDWAAACVPAAAREQFTQHARWLSPSAGVTHGVPRLALQDHQLEPPPATPAAAAAAGGGVTAPVETSVARATDTNALGVLDSPLSTPPRSHDTTRTEPAIETDDGATTTTSTSSHPIETVDAVARHSRTEECASLVWDLLDSPMWHESARAAAATAFAALRAATRPVVTSAAAAEATSASASGEPDTDAATATEARVSRARLVWALQSVGTAALEVGWPGAEQLPKMEAQTRALARRMFAELTGADEAVTEAAPTMASASASRGASVSALVRAAQAASASASTAPAPATTH